MKNQNIFERIWAILKMPPVFLLLVSIIAFWIGGVNSYGSNENSNFFKSTYLCITDGSFWCVIGAIATALLFLYILYAIYRAIKNAKQDNNDVYPGNRTHNGRY